MWKFVRCVTCKLHLRRHNKLSGMIYCCNGGGSSNSTSLQSSIGDNLRTCHIEKQSRKKLNRMRIFLNVHILLSLKIMRVYGPVNFYNYTRCRPRNSIPTGKSSATTLSWELLHSCCLPCLYLDRRKESVYNGRFVRLRRA
jgi:hypothetical protein